MNELMQEAQDLEAKTQELKIKVEAYLQDRTIPLFTRLGMYSKLPDSMHNHDKSPYASENEFVKKFFTNCEDVACRYETIYVKSAVSGVFNSDTLEFDLEEFCDCVAGFSPTGHLSHDLNKAAEEIPEFLEEILRMNINAYKYDW